MYRGTMYKQTGGLINLFELCQPITDVYCGQFTNESLIFVALNLWAIQSACPWRGPTFAPYTHKSWQNHVVANIVQAAANSFGRCWLCHVCHKPKLASEDANNFLSKVLKNCLVSEKMIYFFHLLGRGSRPKSRKFHLNFFNPTLIQVLIKCPSVHSFQMSSS